LSSQRKTFWLHQAHWSSKVESFVGSAHLFQHETIEAGAGSSMEVYAVFTRLRRSAAHFLILTKSSLKATLFR
jgi:hypothetical protein